MGIQTRRRWKALGMVLGAGTLVYLVLLGVLRSTPVLRALRERAVAELAARLPAARLDGPVSVDAALRPVMGPVVLAPPEGKTPLLVVDRITVQPRLWALFLGRLEVGKVILRGVHVQGGRRGEGLADLARALRTGRPPAARSGAGRRVPAPPVLAFSGLEVRLEGAPTGPTPVVFGPLEGRLQVDRQGERTLATLATVGPGRAAGSLEAAWGGGPGTLQIRMQGVGAEAIPDGLRRSLPFEVRGGAVDLSFEATRLDGPSRGEGRLTLRARNLSLFAPRLDPGPVGPLSLHLAGRLGWDAAAQTAALVEAKAALDDAGRAALDLALSVAVRPEPRFTLDLRAMALDWAALTGALPPALAPPRGAPALVGALAGSLHVAGPFRLSSGWQLKGEVDPSHLKAVPSSGGPDLGRPFVHTARLTRGGTRSVVIGPENPAFVPLGELPNHLVRAVLESEDAGFYGHKGFDLSEVQEALADGGRLRGASTLSQQLAKNLFLSRDRTLSRKIREALATVALEVAVGKRRILEIYFNLVEWGDGVYGIGEAARHWFGKDARSLSPKEAVMLATVIPNPVRYDMYRRRGALTPAWELRVAGLLEKLHLTGALDDEAYRAAQAETLAFRTNPGAEPVPPEAADTEPPESEDPD
ncbi:transglycosylase domain-containing protein [Geothrix sp. PMB-07]|uniref:transglycosylase domain-containing protein n=1 Tax=Geothrix sp. PMB-07 TaxID=3068640 RepID=UPI00274172A4|nr:biosynthetic peptidoglycan transglycosylase [Geothrix sp. PMB-07]WLT30976.1 biosynthetic peptidoglycan transglycosylase [Geothrix sp. PMB-07]